MGYNVLDIIDKSINIQHRRKIIIKRAADQDNTIPAMNLFCKVLCKQIDQMINFYDELKDEIKETEFEEIDIITYDKISFLINEFNDRIYNKDVNNVKEYLRFSLYLSKDTYSLFIDIQGRLVKNINDSNTKTYEILTKIINNVEKQIQTIEKTVSL